MSCTQQDVSTQIHGRNFKELEKSETVNARIGEKFNDLSKSDASQRFVQKHLFYFIMKNYSLET